MKKIVAGTAVAMALAVVGMQNASAREFADIYTQCGLGAMIAPKNDAVAAVTNVTWDLGTTAISSEATTPDSCAGGKAQTAAYIYEVYPQLEKDLAKGDGAHLTALLTMAGCDTQAQDAVAHALRSDFATAVSEQGYTSQSRFQQAEGLHQRVHQRIESDFAQACPLS